MGSNIKDFSFEDLQLGNGTIRQILGFKDTNLKFIIEESKGSFHQFRAWHHIYEKNYPQKGPYPTSGYTPFSNIKSELTKWIEQHIFEYEKDMSEPSFWDNLTNQVDNFQLENIDFEDNNPFSPEEKTQVILSLNEARLLIKENVDLTENQFKILDKRIIYLQESVERITNKTDWKSLAIGTILSMLTNMVIDTNTGSEIWKIIIHVFSNIPNLPTPPIVNI